MCSGAKLGLNVEPSRFVMQIVIFCSSLAGLSVAGKNNITRAREFVNLILIIGYLFVITIR